MSDHYPVLLPLAFSLVLPATLAAAPASSGAPTRPNVVLLIADDLRCELGAYGSPLAQTPNLDRLAREAVMFQHAYCQYPLCNPSRTSMLTGRHPTTTHVYGNREYFGTAHPDWVSLPKHFREQGYRTLRTGKIFHGGIDDTEAWTEGGEERRWNNPPPLQPVQRATAPAQAEQHVRTLQRADHARAAQSDRWEAVPEAESADLGDTRVTDRAIDYLRAAKGRGEPFFLACGLSKPHSPLVAPERFFDLYAGADIALPPDFAAWPMVPEGFPAGSIRPNNADLFIRRKATPEAAREMIRAYLACVSYVDWNIGRVLDELSALGLRENTIIVFWGDHGFQLGEKGKWSKAGSLWEQGARVPLIIYDPRAAGNGRASPRIVQSVDLYPTLVELCGLPEPDGLDGRSLAPLLRDPEQAWDHAAYTVWNERGNGISGVVVRTERWRYAEFFGPGAGAFLTDPINDPHELTNLVHDPRHAAVVAELQPLARAYVEGHTELPPEPTAAAAAAREPEGEPRAAGGGGTTAVVK